MHLIDDLLPFVKPNWTKHIKNRISSLIFNYFISSLWNQKLLIFFDTRRDEAFGPASLAYTSRTYSPQKIWKKSRVISIFWIKIDLMVRRSSIVLGVKIQTILWIEFSSSQIKGRHLFLLCLLLWSAFQNGKNRSQMPISQLLYPSFCGGFFLYRKLTTFLRFFFFFAEIPGPE